MAFQLGDIVDARFGTMLRWVVSGFDHRDGIDCAKIVRKYGAVYQHTIRDVADLVPVDRPAFEAGEPVVVDGMKAVFMGRDGLQARVLLAPQRWVIADHELLHVRPAVAVLSWVTLVLENRWKENESWQ